MPARSVEFRHGPHKLRNGETRAKKQSRNLWHLADGEYNHEAHKNSIFASSIRSRSLLFGSLTDPDRRGYVPFKCGLFSVRLALHSRAS
jgi:hypothetical protein